MIVPVAVAAMPTTTVTVPVTVVAVPTGVVPAMLLTDMSFTMTTVLPVFVAPIGFVVGRLERGVLEVPTTALVGGGDAGGGRREHEGYGAKRHDLKKASHMKPPGRLFSLMEGFTGPDVPASPGWT